VEAIKSHELSTVRVDQLFVVLTGFLVMLDHLLFSIPTRRSRSGDGVTIRVIRPTAPTEQVVVADVAKTTRDLENFSPEPPAVKGFADDNENIVQPKERGIEEEAVGGDEGLAVREEEGDEEEGSEESWLEELQRRVADRIPTREEELAEEEERERRIEEEVEEAEEASEESVADVEESREEEGEEGWEKKENAEVD
jgi:hypothetical protein